MVNAARVLKPPAPEAATGDDAACAVRPAHLAQLESIHELLRVLNDPKAGAPQIRPYVEKLGCLRARLERMFARRHALRKDASFNTKLALLGNRAVEQVLLEVLEDLTVLKSELEG